MKLYSGRGGISELLLCAVSLAACGPNDSQRAEAIERRRVECLDKFCQGDIEPKRDFSKDVALKLNGQWFIGPSYYYSTGMNGAAFYWPSKKNREDVPQEERRGNEHTVEIFLRHHDGVTNGRNSMDILAQAEKEGRLVSKNTIRPGLEQWRIKEPGELDPGIWYVATNHVKKEPSAAVLWCRDRNQKYDTCTTGGVFISGISWDMRFSAKYAQDWPEIFLETMRVLQLLTKA